MTTDFRRTLDRVVVLAFFLLSGFSALIYQLVWTQQFSLFFGATASATAAVLASYMFGLGLGAAWIGRWIHRVRRPTRWYAAFEAGIALAALGVAPALELARWVQGLALRTLGFDGGWNPLFYILCSFLILALPTVLMGATLPLLVRFWVDSRQQISRGVASLYMANTLGAAGGTLATGFVLIPRLGLGRTLAVAVVLNLVVAVLALWWFRGRDGSEPAEAAPSEPTVSGEIAGDGARWSKLAPLMYLLICGSGFVGMAYEVYWSRVLTHPLGGSLYAFAIMLASFLVGLSLGSLATTVRRWSRPASWAGFGVAQVGIAGTGLLAIHGLDGVLVDWLGAGHGPSVESLWLVGATLVPSALLLGASFPLAVRAVASSEGDAAPASAKVYAWNTVGTILGSIACGFLFLPRLQFDGTAQLLTLVSLALGTAAFLVARGPWRLGAGVGILGMAGVILWPPPTPWTLLGQSPLASPFEAERVTYLGVGHSATVMVQEVYGEQRLTTNGLPESALEAPGSRPSRYAVAHWLALAPATARPAAEKALVIGFGAGITTHALPDHIQRVDVAEIESEVIEANRALATWRREDPLADPRLRILVDDARSVLIHRPERYDLIISQPSHPWTLGAASLFTSELYAVAAARLTEGGIFTQWIGLRFVDVGLLRSQTATLLEHFAHVEIFRPPPTGAALLLASQEPIDLEAAARAHWSAVADRWRLAGIESPGGLLAGRWLDAEGTRAFAEGAEVSTDYRNLLMIYSPWVTAQAGDQKWGALMSLDAIRTWQATRGDLFPLRYLLQFQQFDRAKVALEGVRDPALGAVGQALWDQARGNSGQALVALDRHRAGGASHEALAALLIAHSNRAVGVPGPLVEEIEGVPELASVFRAWQRLRLGDVAGAADLDPELASIHPEHPIYPMALRMRILWRQRTGGAERAREAMELVEPRLAITSGPQSLMLRARLALAAEDHDTLFSTLLELGGQADRRNIEPPQNLRDLVAEMAEDRAIRNDARWPELLDLLGLEADDP